MQRRRSKFPVCPKSAVIIAVVACAIGGAALGLDSDGSPAASDVNTPDLTPPALPDLPPQRSPEAELGQARAMAATEPNSTVVFLNPDGTLAGTLVTDKADPTMPYTFPPIDTDTSELHAVSATIALER